jgi:hypothetical protein
MWSKDRTFRSPEAIITDSNYLQTAEHNYDTSSSHIKERPVVYVVEIA